VAEQPKSFQETLRELWNLLTTYARQETIGPFQSLGKRIGFGLAGSLLVSLGWFLLVLATVRFLQTHVLPGFLGTFFLVHDWLVYLVAVLLLGIGMFLAYRRARKADPALPAPRSTPAALIGNPTADAVPTPSTRS